MKISELIDGIRKKDIVMPEFQREYVWNREQAKKLMSSLLKDYPVGALLFWKTDNPPELKNINATPDKIGTLQVILDGQQRLTTLYLLITGKIPPYYKESDIQNDPRSLYFNLETKDFQYYQASVMKSNPLWVPVVDVMTESLDLNPIKLASQIYEGNSSLALKYAQLFTNNQKLLFDIQKFDMPILAVPSTASLNDAIDIFDLVNRQGTKLTEADLALTHITGHWAQARRIMKRKISELEKQNFSFDLTFITRAMTGVVAKRGLFETIHKRSYEELIKGWKELEKILDYMVLVLKKNAFIDSTSEINSTNIFIPWIVYLSLHKGVFSSEAEKKQAIHWLYLANIWGRYTGQTTQRLEHDISIITRYDNPWEELRKAIIDQRGRIEVQASDLQGREAQHPLYRMVFLLSKAHGAVDWFNGIPLGGTKGKYFGMHNHHIFPQSVLYEEMYDSNNHLHKKIVNEIANRAFLTANTNQRISNLKPEVYLASIEEKYPGALVHQFIPMNKELWKIENYDKFLKKRRELIASKINEYLNSLITEPEEKKLRSISELISLGESSSLEFKSTFQWDVVQDQPNKGLRLSVMKTIAAFLNSDGGTLVIGVEDNGNLYGLAQDLKIVHNSTDKFLNLLNNFIDESIGVENKHFIDSRIETINGNHVCLVEVDAASSPVYVKHGKEIIFYVRSGTTTKSLDPEETVNYVNSHWGV